MKIYQKIVVWGSGIRGKGFIDYIGCENVIVIVDNGLSREHSEYCSVPIVGFDTYLEKYRDYSVSYTHLDVYKRQSLCWESIIQDYQPIKGLDDRRRQAA